MKEKRFNGPLFIVGLSRSGTKLIRDLLNRNKNIAIPEIETHFIPQYLLENKLSIEELYYDIKNSSFVGRFPDKEYPSLERLKEIKPVENKMDLIETLLKFYALEGNSKWQQNIIWGDKTPSYLRHLDLLKSEFPESKFIHIIRDPRDRALSVKKTWNKSMNRATELWRREIENSRKWKNSKNNYIEFTYEDLLSDTEGVLRKLCKFLQVEFDKEMLQLSKPSEKYGDNSDRVGIGKRNSAKSSQENPKSIKRLEEIAYPIMKEMNYEIKYAKKYKPFPSYQMFLFKFIDFVNFKISNLIKGY